ncbi:TadE family protein [Alsobacter sp. KACC 23698]|uniref:TadE family protein n=1 Tax=Alsobacter sp. KACC 23698 TaxID=3149229 RepID=A0AAU7JGK0_9HYPH
METVRIRIVEDERGSVAVEAALALPFVIAFAFAIFEFGGMLYAYEMVQTGVRDAARYLARVPDPTASETQARAIAVTGSPSGSGASRVAGWSDRDVTVSYASAPNPVDAATGLRAYRGSDPLRIVTVSTTFQPRGLGLLSAIGLGPIQVAASHTERHVGQ